MKGIDIVLFSSGVTEKNQTLIKIKEELENMGYSCSCWRDLFAGAHDHNNIALLPMLIKKIPSFDYAVLICEGHDTTCIEREEKETVYTMRDNVLFEIGLSTMALGQEHVILLANEKVRIPEDLTGINELAIKKIPFSSNKDIPDVTKEIDRYIKNTKENISPVMIGAASITACGYLESFVLRLLEHAGKGIKLGEKEVIFALDKVFIHIVLPETYSKETPGKTKEKLNKYKKGEITEAGTRAVEFRYELHDDELHIYDYPTTLITSYDTAKAILNLNADDKEDKAAEIRFIDKEMRLFKYTLQDFLKEQKFRSFVKSSIEQNHKKLQQSEKESILEDILKVSDHIIIEVSNY